MGFFKGRLNKDPHNLIFKAQKKTKINSKWLGIWIFEDNSITYMKITNIKPRSSLVFNLSKKIFPFLKGEINGSKIISVYYYEKKDERLIIPQSEVYVEGSYNNAPFIFQMKIKLEDLDVCAKENYNRLHYDSLWKRYKDSNN